VHDLDGVFTYDDYSVVVAAHLAEALGHIGLSPETAKRAKNKPAMRALCRDRGLPAPRFVQLDPWADDVAPALAQARISFPVVAKPSHGAGSVLVRRADDLAELESTLREPYFMELGGQIPSALPQEAQAELVRVASGVLAALGVRDCCVHFEARWTARGAVSSRQTSASAAPRSMPSTAARTTSISSRAPSASRSDCR